MSSGGEPPVPLGADGKPLEDLAKYAHPVSDFLALSGDVWPVTEEAVRKYALSPEQLAAYQRDGFLDAVPICNAAQVERLRADLSAIMDPSHPANALFHEFNANEAPATSGKVLFHSLGAWRISPAFHDLLFHPRYLVPAAQLLGVDALRLWHDQLFVKPPRVGSVVAWHQDLSYWTRTEPMAHLTIHLALDAQTLENGALHYVPGSHTWPLLPVTSRHFDDMESIRTVVSPDRAAQVDAAVPVTLQPGQASFHHPLSVHGSFGNHSDGPRRATVINLFADGTRSATDAPLLEGLPAYPSGTPQRGRFFPLLTGHGTGGAGIVAAAGGVPAPEGLSPPAAAPAATE